ncbi:MAG TPA: hypothetical protein VK978_05160 [Candidatus Saccharimonadales bacterium]|nr:hypothetical protein [Candidatus Saccharimonadales bacterium]
MRYSSRMVRFGATAPFLSEHEWSDEVGQDDGGGNEAETDQDVRVEHVASFQFRGRGFTVG